ncbi:MULTISPECIES: phage virion morphogenesis protein [Klebsiella pneumoniae complex]|uniref:phage virion morphogenesis protein n=1 Tax=Klebsiella pneumoniae complex TaxID=3390273 RepID=UPI000E2CADF8|nr:phage virion morphogenesis protein [Klebsiella variicola]HCA9839106.1 phage virion morphogenesis protein [Klebsiella variicola subsp. variicola]EKU8624218.1 phage virion morphogenesis protein [Klebsiella variicola]SXD58363.1 phage tail completion protein [Klebsiella variicola]GKL10537.1 virion morphogenesis protein [Klebsiella variicola]HBQ5665675.1 phage virion morphogenesis protein [Klebsiella variicola]
MNDFKPFEDKLAGLIAALSPAGRRRMTVDITKKLRQRQQQRIKLQKAPDGSPFTPRKRQPVRAKKGRIKREMFAKLRTNRFMKTTGNDSAAVVEFTGKVQRIARVHQLGLKDKPSTKSATVDYPQRQLLGFTDEDRQLVESVIIDYLNDVSSDLS